MIDCIPVAESLEMLVFDHISPLPWTTPFPPLQMPKLSLFFFLPFFGPRPYIHLRSLLFIARTGAERTAPTNFSVSLV